MKTNNNMKNKYYNNSTYKGISRPKGDENVHVGMSEKALEDLPKSSVTFKADPYTAAEPASVKYPILSEFNRIVGGNYAGDSNLDGGNVQQYANSFNSGFLYYADFMRLKARLNYHYTPVLADPKKIGYGLIDEQIKAMDEAYSLLGATTYTALAINNYVIETDMAMGSSVGTPVEGQEGVFRYTDKATCLYGSFKMYQLILQSLGNAFTWHNSFRLKQGTMIRSSWNREVPQLNALFGLFNKASWINLLKGISLSFEGEYVDRSYLTQAAMLNVMPSRRSNSITDPVLELQTSYALPKVFRIIYTDASNTTIGKIFDFEEMLPDFESTIDAFCDRLAAENIMAWARNVQTNYNTTANNYFNETKAYLDKIIDYFSVFKRAFSDYREALDILSRTGTVGWFKGYKPDVIQDNDAQVFRVMIIEDLYRLIMSGSPSVSFNNTTKRWATYSLWNMYDGIPEYDSKQGGSFLTFSCKDIEFTDDDDGNRLYLPVALIPQSHIIYATSRDGYQMTIDTITKTISQDPVLSRLVPLPSQSALTIRVPRLQNLTANTPALTVTTRHRSAMYKTLTQICGLGAVPNSIESNQVDISLDPDIIAVYQIEVEDTTNIAINYARTNAPIRSSSRETSFLGFFGVGKLDK